MALPRTCPRRLATISATTLAAAALSVAGPVQPALASGRVLYAYAHGGATSPTSCSMASETSSQCTLAQALAKAAAGDIVALATPGRDGHYVGNWVIGRTGTTASASLTIKPAAGVTRPVLDGNKGQAVGCGTKICNGPVLTVAARVHLDLDDLTIRNGDNTTNGLGGAIQNIHGGTVTVSRCTFSDNYSNVSGGAIDNAEVSGPGTLIVLASAFVGNYAVNADGGAIANADVGGKGSVTVSGSDFSGNSAINGNGGAIDSGDTRGTGVLSVSASSFVGNIAGRAGAIDNGDNGTGTLTVRDSTFSDNVAVLDDAGAIDNADWGTGTLSVTGSTFTSNKTIGDGGAIDNADNTDSRGRALVSTSTFWGNIADVHGGAIDSSDVGSEGSFVLSASTFSRNTANNIYGYPPGPGGGAIFVGKNSSFWVAADIFNGPCLSAAGSWRDGGYNVGRDDTCLGEAKSDVSHGATHLGPLARHGGPTETSLPLIGNPAVGRIPYGTSVALDRQTLALCPTTDQRGKRSDAKGSCDSGSVQSSG